jgi:hypothetical protein
MPTINLPVLGLGATSDHNRDSDRICVQWADGTPCGILGNIVDALARPRIDEAEEVRKQELRAQNVAVLEDYR